MKRGVIMTCVEKKDRMKKETESVLLYMASPAGLETVKGYFSKLGNSKPNYTGLLSSMGMCSGTTKDGVKFDSIYVNRKDVTKSLRKMYTFSE